MPCVIKPCCTFESLTVHHCASPPTQPIVLRVCESLIEATDFIYPSGDTTTCTDLRCAANCRYRCVSSAATRSGARCRCHSAAAVSLCRSVSADPSASPALRGLCCIWCPTFSHLTAPPVTLSRTSPPALVGHHAGRFSSSAALTGSALLAKFDPLVVIVHLSLVLQLCMSIRRCLSTNDPPAFVPWLLASKILFLKPSPNILQFNMSVYPRPLLDAIAFVTLEPVHTLACEFSPRLPLLSASRDLPPFRKPPHNIWLSLSVAHAKLASSTV